MRCLKCGDCQTNLNKNRFSCRVHKIINSSQDTCADCDNVRHNCKHEWVYFYLFWTIIENIKVLFNKNFDNGSSHNNNEYVEL